MQFITAYSYIVQNIEIFYVNSIGGVIISMLTSSVVDARRTYYFNNGFGF
jgi:hypothetical protein